VAVSPLVVVVAAAAVAVVVAAGTVVLVFVVAVVVVAFAVFVASIGLAEYCLEMPVWKVEVERRAPVDELVAVQKVASFATEAASSTVEPQVTRMTLNLDQ
jgi:hypothetical protein